MTFHAPSSARRALAVLVCALAAAAAHATAAAADAYRIVDLGVPAGASRSFGNGINNTGAVVGYGGWNEARQAFIYEPGTGLRTLGTLVAGGESIAWDANANGLVVGEATNAQGVFHAFVWEAGAMRDLGSLGGRDAFSTAHDLNVHGQVVGGSWTRKGPMHAFIWGGKKLKDIGVPSGLDESYAEAINNNGVVVGRAWGASSPEHAFIYDGTMRDLGTFDAFQGGASDINDDGTIVGYHKYNPGYPRAVVYAAGLVIEIPPLYGTSTSGATALAVNNRGDVVGESDGRAFLYSDGRVIDVNTLLPDGSGWVLTSASDINDAGTIVGSGFHFGQQRAFKLSLTPLARYLPELRYDQQEVYRADSAAEITDNWTASYTNRLLRDDGTVLAVSDPSDPAPDLSLDFLGANAASSLESDYVDEANDNRDADAQRMHADPTYANKVYGREVPLTDGGLLLQYWVFYYNNPKTFFGGGDHEGDWEMIQVHLDKNEIPLEATYAQHKTGEGCPWERIERTPSGRPIVYVAQESHAAYFTAGDHKIVVDNFFDVWDYADGLGEHIIPSLIEVTAAPTWMQWAGHFGGADSSPRSPYHQGKWDDPVGFESTGAACTAPVAGGLSLLGTTARPDAPAAPQITARRVGDTVVVDYRLAASGARPWLLVTTVDGARDRFTPTSRRTVVGGVLQGRVVQPVALSRGPLRVLASVRAEDGARSRTVAVPVG